MKNNKMKITNLIFIIILGTFVSGLTLADECDQYKKVASEAKNLFRNWVNTNAAKHDELGFTPSKFNLDGAECSVQVGVFKCKWIPVVTSSDQSIQAKLMEMTKEKANRFAGCFGLTKLLPRNEFKLDDKMNFSDDYKNYYSYYFYPEIHKNRISAEVYFKAKAYRYVFDKESRDAELKYDDARRNENSEPHLNDTWESEGVKDLLGVGLELDSEGFQIPDVSDVKTYSNPKLRPVEVVQQNEMTEYEAAGLIPNPYKAGYLTQGWLVNGCVVIAPRHAIIDNGYVDKDLTNMQVEFKVGYQGKGSFKQQVKIKPIACGSGNNGDKIGGEDFCIFKADRNLKGLVKPMRIGAIDFQRWDVVPATSVGFFPQASKHLDVLAKDVNAKIVDGDSTYLESRAAVVSGAGLIKESSDTHDQYMVGMQVGNFKVVNSLQIINKLAELKGKNPNIFKCN